MVDRDYTLKRLLSKSMNPEDFQYESLWAPPLYTMLGKDDIDQIHYIATSPSYSTKLKEKYKIIDDIMQARGFKRLMAGTNRIAYEPTFANNFIIKVAYDSVAMKDSIREFYNQQLLKPFCTKVFEVSPCGTIGVFEKVQPITNTDEFLSVASDIYLLLNTFLSGPLIMDDIGVHYFMNYGVRMGFGPVVLDFPYVYRVDPKKIYCSKPNHTDPTGYCNGPIDYDAGFNKLICTKCGCVYKPFEIAQRLEYKPQFINTEREDLKMQITIKGGKNHVFQEINTGDFSNPVTAIKSNKLNKKVEKIAKEEAEAKKKDKEEEKTVNGMAPAENIDDIVDAVLAEEKVEKAEEEEKDVVSAVSFDEEIKGVEADPGYEEEEFDIGKLVADINHSYYYTDKSDDEKAQIAKTLCEMLKNIFIENIDLAMAMFANILRGKKNLKDDIVKEFLEKNSCSINNQFIKLLIQSGNYTIKYETGDCVDNEDSIMVAITPTIFKKETDKPVVSSEKSFCIVPKSEFEMFIVSEDIASDSAPEDEEEFVEPTGIDLSKAEIVSKKDLFSNESTGKVIVVKNDDASYLTIENKILAIDHISGRKLDEITIVPKDWYDNAKEALDKLKDEAVEASEEE